MAPQLNTTTRSSSQSTTQSPQSAVVGSGVGGAQTGNVQTGTSADLLRSQTGIPLTSTPVSTVNLHAGTSASTAVPQVSAKHHANVGLLSLSALLIVVAIALFVIDSRSVKTTT